MARKPLIAPGSILPPQEPAPGDLLSRIVAKDRARRTGEEAPESPASDDAEIQVPVNTEAGKAGNTENSNPRNTETREPGETEIRSPVNTGVQGHRSDAGAGRATRTRNLGTQEARNTGSPGQGREQAHDAGPEDSPEPTDKATFDLPRSLHQRLKVQAAMERRPARAIVIELLTQYLDEHPMF